MNTIFYIMGKSASGKDTIYKNLLASPSLHLKPVVLYTTRPIRKGETNGVEYYFSTVENLSELRKMGKVIEERCYQTMKGPWHYFTVADKQFSAEAPLLMNGTLESYLSTREFFGSQRVIPLYIEVEDGLRLERALNRERTQPIPQYEEMCRRFLADQRDFSEEKLLHSKITKRFSNVYLEDCLKALISYIQSETL